ncbi:L-amino-acid oxidase [Colletotrichum spinosum]|uniref:L-amino-acid oxidase n=1 Tax=Colletotrichum spinosum TaxID=1347390 RepID=A0A4R8Q799_9PEZI|nr:L-amino-acid oxidase [Colletotrichum spinosum]
MARWFLSFVAGSALVAASGLPLKLETRSAVTSRVSNIHLTIEEPLDGTVTFTYGSCRGVSLEDSHHIIAKSEVRDSQRLVWVLPEDANSDGCISAWSVSGSLVGRSEPQTLHHNWKRRVQKRSIHMSNETGFDTLGAWFEGINLLKDKEPAAVDVDAAKSKQIAIVGAGMAGLMSCLVLSQAGMTNISIIEAGQRLGGRVHTEYLSGGPFDYSYQEMGPMRFPEHYVDPKTNTTYNISDHQLVFQLAAEMNELNNHSKNLSVDFIPWIQSNSNGLSYKNGIKLASGLPPTLAQIAANSSLAAATVYDASTNTLNDEVDEYMPGSDFSVRMAQNMYKAHGEWVRNGLGGLGGDVWSEYAFMVNYLRGSLNSTDALGMYSATSFWDTLYEGMYFQAASYKTIDGGLSRLPLAFHPLVDDITTMNRKIERVQFDSETSRVNLQYRDSFKNQTFQDSTYDYALLAVPFSIIRKWRLPSLPLTISNAIKELPYTSACGTTSDIPGIGSTCYPSYNINGTGPATMLASYISGDWGHRWASATEEEHVQYVLDAMVEVHGEDTRDLYTGKYNRRCWVLDPLESGSWVSPVAGQHQLYIPEYFKTYDNMIFIGEHTSYTHAWISSALESGIRGSVQLLLELGLVDEAKAAVNKWMARWIDI